FPDDVLFSRRGRMGRIVSPRHTLPPNTTCTYHFHGYPGDLIWLSFTSYNLQILQQAIHDNNTLGRVSWVEFCSAYYYSASNPKLNRNLRVNIDNAWNPVDTYIYGPTQSSVFNQENKYSGYQGAGPAGGSGGAGGSGKPIAGVKDSLNFISKSSKEVSAAAVVSSDRNSAVALMSTKGKRRLMLEIYDYETPKLCDHTAIGSGVSGSSALMGGNKQRPCSPLESYVSTGRDLDASCEGLAWYIEAQSAERSLFVQTWGAYLPVDPTSEDAMRCHTKNRLMIYSGRPLRPMRVVCPAQSGPRPMSLHIFSEDWTNGQPLFMNKPINLVLEPILKEPGDISFTWLEIHRTKNALLQQLDLHVNASVTTGMGSQTSSQSSPGSNSGIGGLGGAGSAANAGGSAGGATANETLNEFGFFPKESDCEYKCPEIDACIAASLWCDGHHNCPSGFDESEEECGTARKLLELPGGVFAALGCIAAALTACLIFCMFGLMRKRKKSVVQKGAGVGGMGVGVGGMGVGGMGGMGGVGIGFMNGASNGNVSAASIGTLKKDFKKEALYIDPAS
uniref:Uncharacterized protein LOC108044176 n=1 Tax=Drosophila rhopaloa TaxID=1041015 RepID=A0A6P4EK21_DRORH